MRGILEVSCGRANITSTTVVWINYKPANSRLAVRRSLSNAQRLTNLRLCEAERETTDLELLCELSHLVKVDSIDHNSEM